MFGLKVKVPSHYRFVNPNRVPEKANPAVGWGLRVFPTPTAQRQKVMQVPIEMSRLEFAQRSTYVRTEVAKLSRRRSSMDGRARADADHSEEE